MAAGFVGGIYIWGQGVAIDYPRAMAAYKVGAEGGDARFQWQVGFMYYKGLGVDVDYAQALPWIEKAAAQDHLGAVGSLGVMYYTGRGVTPSWCRARVYYKRALELSKAMKLGSLPAVESMQALTQSIQEVTSRRSIHSAPSSLVRDLTLPYTHTTALPPLARAGRPPHG